MSGKYVAYVGTYTHEKNKGIHIYDVDVEKGRIYERNEVEVNNPSYIVLSNSQNFLYSIADEGVVSYRILADGNLEYINHHSTNGMRGCHLCITKNDNFLAVSGYHDGKITIMHINSDGSIGGIADEIFHKGIGSISERNFRPHINWSVFTPDEQLLCVCDLGIDQIKLYEFDHTTGKLKLYDVIRSQLESAPREMTFSPDGKYAYVLCELKNLINVYAYNNDKDKGSFELIQNIYTLKSERRANSAAVDIHFTADGNHLLCSNAGDNAVTMYNVDKETGMLTNISSLPISGHYPKFIQLFPDEKHLLSMNQDSNTITIFTLHLDKGLIVMNGPELKISKPNNMVIKQL